MAFHDNEPLENLGLIPSSFRRVAIASTRIRLSEAQTRLRYSATRWQLVQNVVLLYRPVLANSPKQGNFTGGNRAQADMQVGVRQRQV
jgi:hypothetical protein